MSYTIDSIEIRHYRRPLDPPFHAAWDPQPRRSFTATLVRVRAGPYEGVGSGTAMLGFAGHEALFLGQLRQDDTLGCIRDRRPEEEVVVIRLRQRG